MKDIIESCPECDDKQITFQEYDQVKQCEDCKTYWKLDSYWESDEGCLVDILMEVKTMEESTVDMTGLTVVGAEPVSREQEERKKENKYVREVAPNVFIDVYDVIKAFGVTCPARAHAVKKLLCTGQRGHKDIVTDIKESIEALERAIELEKV